MRWTRRRFLAATGPLAAGLGLGLGRRAQAIGPGSRFRIARLVLDGAERDVRPGAASRLVWEVLKRTSVDGDLDSPAVRIDDPAMFQHPFLVLFGEEGFPAPPDAHVAQLRRFLASGGFLLADSCGGPQGSGFDASFRALVLRMFPDLALEPLPRAHTVYRSFYLVDRPSGRLEARREGL